MNIDDIFPSKYLKAADLQGKSYTMTISSIDFEDFNEGERKPIIYFREAEKGMVLNKTNAYSISAIYGSDTDAWMGQSIEVFSMKVNFQGEMKDALRVKAPTVQGTPKQNTYQAAQQAGVTQTPAQGFDERNPPPMADDEIPF